MPRKVSDVSAERPFHHGRLRPALLEHALALLEEGGIEALSLRAVARGAGVSPRAPYRHFADKAALLEAIAIQGFASFRDELGRVDAACGDDTQALVEQGWTYVRFAVDRPHLFRLMFGRPPTWQDIPGAERDRPGTAYDLFAGRIRALVPPEDVDLAIAAAWSSMHGIAALALDGWLGVPPSGLEDHVRRLCSYLATKLTHRF